MTLACKKIRYAVMPTYRRKCKFTLLIHFLAMTILYRNNICTFSALMLLNESEFLAHNLYMYENRKRAIPGKSAQANADFTTNLALCFSFVAFATWLVLLLFSCGDVHPNPGPLSTSSSSSNFTSSSGMSNTLFSSLSLNHNLSFVHYNVQSIFSKLEILQAELFDFDILAFTETWLSPSIDINELLLHSYNTPERKDRAGDNHGGVMIYVKDCLHYKRRADLESRNIESIWIELTNNHKRILFGLFYRPPNSDSNYLSDIEDSKALAVDSPGISDIIITGDFNLNVLNPQTARKIDSVCTQFSLYQSICEPTHFTENSSSLIDILLVNNKTHLIVSGVGDPFLNQEIRYHCPIYGIFKFSKPKFVSFTRHIWHYDRGNYDLMRNKTTSFDWDSIMNNDINIYANNMNTTVTAIAKECIPNRCIKIKPSEPPWITTDIKRNIRKRKRAYKKVKRTNSESDWKKFKTLRNKVVQNIRDSKKLFYDKIAAKLTSENLSSKDWWTTLKTFIAPNSKTSIPPLEFNDTIYTQDNDKANV